MVFIFLCYWIALYTIEVPLVVHSLFQTGIVMYYSITLLSLLRILSSNNDNIYDLINKSKKTRVVVRFVYLPAIVQIPHAVVILFLITGILAYEVFPPITLTCIIAIFSAIIARLFIFKYIEKNTPEELFFPTSVVLDGVTYKVYVIRIKYASNKIYMALKTRFPIKGSETGDTYNEAKFIFSDNTFLVKNLKIVNHSRFIPIISVEVNAENVRKIT